MNIGETRKKIEEVLDIYRKRLDNIPDDLFMVTPPDGGDLLRIKVWGKRWG